MSTATNKAVVLRFIHEVWNEAKYDTLKELISPSYILPGVGQGPEGSRQNAISFRPAFPDLTVEVEEVIAENDRVMAWMRLRGTHRGTFRGYPPTEREAVWDEVGIWTVRDGQLQEGRFLADMFGLRKQLGLLPDTAP